MIPPFTFSVSEMRYFRVQQKIDYAAFKKQQNVEEEKRKRDEAPSINHAQVKLLKFCLY